MSYFPNRIFSIIVIDSHHYCYLFVIVLIQPSRCFVNQTKGRSSQAVQVGVGGKDTLFLLFLPFFLNSAIPFFISIVLPFPLSALNSFQGLT